MATTRLLGTALALAIAAIGCTSSPVERCLSEAMGAAYAIDDTRALGVRTCAVQGSGSGTRIALRHQDGAPGWDTRLPGTLAMGSGPGEGLLVTDDTAYVHVVDDGGHETLRAYALADGTARWPDDLVHADARPTDGTLGPSPRTTRVTDELVLEEFPDGDADVLLAIERTNGSVRWRRPLAADPRPRSSSADRGWLELGDRVALAQGLADAANRWSAISLADGTTLAAGAPGESACVDGPHVLVRAGDRLYRLPDDVVGERIEVARVGDSAILSACASHDGDMIVFVESTPAGGGAYSTSVMRLAGDDWRERWRITLPQLSHRGGVDGEYPVALGGELPRHVLVATLADRETELHALDLETGRITARTGPLTATSIHLHRHGDRTVVVLDDDVGDTTTLASFAGDTGTLLGAARIAPFDHHRVTGDQIRGGILWITNVFYLAAIDLGTFAILTHEGDAMTLTPAPEALRLAP